MLAARLKNFGDRIKAQGACLLSLGENRPHCINCHVLVERRGRGAAVCDGELWFCSDSCRSSRLASISPHRQ